MGVTLLNFGDFLVPEDSLDLPGKESTSGLLPVSFDFALTYEANDARIKQIHKALENICRPGMTTWLTTVIIGNFKLNFKWAM